LNRLFLILSNNFKVLSIQKRITDTVLTGGPTSRVAEDSALGKVAKVATGMKTIGDYTKTEEQQAQEQLLEAERTQCAVTLAQREQDMLKAQQGLGIDGGGGGDGRDGAGFDTTNPMSQLSSVLLASPPPLPPPATSARTAGATHCALYDCDAEDDGELSFRVGDLICVTRKDDSGWWEGTVVGAEYSGIFPANYIETI
jgi:hypothetical protein